MGKQKRNWKFWCLLLLMLFFAGGITVHTAPVQVQAAASDGWRTTDDGKYYYRDGKALTGWQTIDGKKYYFNPSTKLMTTGCKWISSYWYYFGNDGAMRTNTWGKNVSNGKTYYLYFQSNGKAVKDAFKTIDGKTYYFSARSVMATDGGILTDPVIILEQTACATADGCISGTRLTGSIRRPARCVSAR